MGDLWDTALGYWDDLTGAAGNVANTANNVLQDVQDTKNAFENLTLNEKDTASTGKNVSTNGASGNVKTAYIVGGAVVGVVVLVLLLRK